MAKENYEQTTINIPVKSGDQVCLRRIYKNHSELAAPVLLVHDVCSSSESYLNEARHPKKITGGLAMYLARAGYDVYVADFRGRGNSWPKLSKHSDFGAHEIINEDLPAMVRAIVRSRGYARQIWVGHGFGSALLASYYARYGSEIASVERCIHFAPARVKSGRQWFDWLRNETFMSILSKVYGYIPAEKWAIAPSNESVTLHRDYLDWCRKPVWLDPKDGFDYAVAVRTVRWPKSLYFANEGRKSLLSLNDVREFMHSLGGHDGRMISLMPEDKSAHNYDHFGVLQDNEALEDHFPMLLEWLNN